MESPAFPVLSRRWQKIENLWRERLDQAFERYQTAMFEYRRLLVQEPAGHAPSPDSPLYRSRRAESDALTEYLRVLRIFRDITIRHKLPGEPFKDTLQTAPDRPPAISVVDDDESIRDSTRTLLRSAGYRVTTFASAELFWDSGAVGETDCIVLDIRMPGMGGLELQRRLNGSRAGVPIVFLTAHDDARNRNLAMDGGAVDFLCKPFDASTLVSAVQTALTRHAVNLELEKRIAGVHSEDE